MHVRSNSCLGYPLGAVWATGLRARHRSQGGASYLSLAHICRRTLGRWDCATGQTPAHDNNRKKGCPQSQTSDISYLSLACCPPEFGSWGWAVGRTVRRPPWRGSSASRSICFASHRTFNISDAAVRAAGAGHRARPALAHHRAGAGLVFRIASSIPYRHAASLNCSICFLQLGQLGLGTRPDGHLPTSVEALAGQAAQLTPKVPATVLKCQVLLTAVWAAGAGLRARPALAHRCGGAGGGAGAGAGSRVAALHGGNRWRRLLRLGPRLLRPAGRRRQLRLVHCSSHALLIWTF